MDDGMLNFLLLISTWLMAHIYATLCDILRAVDANLQVHESAAVDAAAASAAHSSELLPKGSAEPPPVSRNRSGSGGPPAERPSLKAGFSCPYAPPGTKATHAWTDLSAETFRVRCGPNYQKNGFKAPSGPALGKVVAVDCLRSEGKIFNFLALNHIALPDPSPNWNEIYPEFLVMNQRGSHTVLPSSAPPQPPASDPP